MNAVLIRGSNPSFFALVSVLMKNEDTNSVLLLIRLLKDNSLVVQHLVKLNILNIAESVDC